LLVRGNRGAFLVVALSRRSEHVERVLTLPLVDHTGWGVFANRLCDDIGGVGFPAAAHPDIDSRFPGALGCDHMRRVHSAALRVVRSTRAARRFDPPHGAVCGCNMIDSEGSLTDCERMLSPASGGHEGNADGHRIGYAIREHG
jgi:hypothetical protein